MGNCPRKEIVLVGNCPRKEFVLVWSRPGGVVRVGIFQ